MARALRDAGVRSVNVSLIPWIDVSSEITGRDLHVQVLHGIDAAISAGFDQIKLNTVLMRGRNEDQLIPLIEFAAARFDPAIHRADARRTTEVLDEENFMSIPQTHDRIALRQQFRSRVSGNGRHLYIPGRRQRRFIGAMTNLHFCESCNKLRLTCDGKLRPCLGSYLEFDIMKPLRGASDESSGGSFSTL
jgi:cyclic pyranopterin phosphate synthase